MRRRTSLVGAWLLVTCGCDGAGPPPGGPVAKSIFALADTDFQDHVTFRVHPDAIQALAASTQDTAITVEKGEVLLIEAHGTIDVDGTIYGPDGDPLFGGTDYPLWNRPINALFGVIGQASFVIGRDAALLAPASGALELLLNTCSGCSVTSDLEVTIHSCLGDDVELATEPRIDDNRLVGTGEVTVEVAASWMSTGVTLARGQKVFIDASGTVVVGADSYDAGGIKPTGGTNYQLLNRRVYRLHGRVGETVVPLGTSAAFLSPTDGELELIVNHAGDATGTLTVTVGLGVVPAQGLIGLGATDVVTAAPPITLPPDGQWHDGGVTVARGDPLLLGASGSISGGDVGGEVDPYGMSAFGGTDHVISNMPANALHARVAAQDFYVGGDVALLAPAPGPVELVINTTRTCSGCTGSFDVTVTAP